MEKEQKIRLVISDVDGTLLDSDGVLSPVDFVAVGRLRQAGIKFSLSSARPPFGMRWLVRTLGVDCTCAALNGAVLFRPGGNIITELPLERGLVKELQGWMLQRGLDVWVYTQKHWFVPRLSGPQVRENSDCLRTTPKRYTRLDEVQDPILKLVGVNQNPDIIAACTNELRSELGDRACVTISPPHCIDLTHSLAHKGRAAAAITLAEGVSRAEVAAVGDSPGDIPMFDAVGTSVAMGQSCGKVRRVASQVTRSNTENGFAWAIEYVLRGKLIALGDQNR
ncbi:MAG: Cof-type HAD-IIB family hydrolase [Candidatus Acidiferrum sp.]